MVAQIGIQTVVNTSQLAQGQQAYINALNNMNNATQSTANKMNQAMSGTGGGLKGAVTSVDQLASGMAGLNLGNLTGAVFLGNQLSQAWNNATNAIKQYGQEALQAVAWEERLTISYAAMMANELRNRDATLSMTEAMDKAKPSAEATLQWTRKIAIESPFTSQDVANTYQMALGFGFASEEAKDLTAGMLDWSAATGKTGQHMSRLMLNLGQVKALGKLSGRELRDFAMAGLNVNAALQKETGKTTAELSAMQRAGTLSADVAIRAITKALKDYEGMGKMQATTFSGLISSMTDIKQVVEIEFFKPIFEAFKPLLTDVVNTLTDPKVLAAIQSFGAAIAAPISGFVEKVRQLPTIIQPYKEAVNVGGLGAGQAVENVSQIVHSQLADDKTKKATADLGYNLGVSMAEGFKAAVAAMLTLKGGGGGKEGAVERIVNDFNDIGATAAVNFIAGFATVLLGDQLGAIIKAGAEKALRGMGQNRDEGVTATRGAGGLVGVAADWGITGFKTLAGGAMTLGAQARAAVSPEAERKAQEERIKQLAAGGTEQVLDAYIKGLLLQMGTIKPAYAGQGFNYAAPGGQSVDEWMQGRENTRAAQGLNKTLAPFNLTNAAATAAPLFQLKDVLTANEKIPASFAADLFKNPAKAMQQMPDIMAKNPEAAQNITDTIVEMIGKFPELSGVMLPTVGVLDKFASGMLGLEKVGGPAVQTLGEFAKAMQSAATDAKKAADKEAETRTTFNQQGLKFLDKQKADVENYQRQVIQQDEDFARSRVKAQESFAKQTARSDEDYKISLQDALDSFNLRETDIQESYYESRTEAAKSFGRDVEKAEEAHQRKMQLLNRDHNRNLQEAIANRDAVAYVREMRDYEVKRSDEEEQYQYDTKQRNRAYAVQLKDMEENFAKSREKRLKDFERQRAEADDHYRRAQARRQKDFNEQLAESDRNYNEQKNLRARRFADQQALEKQQWELAQAQGLSQTERITGTYKTLLDTMWATTQAKLDEITAAATPLTPEGSPLSPTPMYMAAGGSFVVPPGYQNDRFPVRVSSGERVTVTPAGVQHSGALSVNVNVNGTVTPDFERQVIQQMTLVVRQALTAG